MRKFLIAVVGIVFIFLLGWGWILWQDAKQTVDEKIYHPVDAIDHHLSVKKIKDRQSINILLLGIDVEKGSEGRSDTVILMTLKPKTKTIQLTSIPRDMRTFIPKVNKEDKINHAYAFGKEDLSIATVEHLLNIDIDYYMRINLTGLKELIDALDGIKVHNDFEWEDEGYYFPEGPVELDGEEALVFVRMRKADPLGDLGRTKRQRDVVEAMIQKASRLSTIPRIHQFLDIVEDHMATNLSFSELKDVLLGYFGTKRHIEQYQLQGTSQRIDGIDYYIVSEEEIAKVQRRIIED